MSGRRWLWVNLGLVALLVIVGVIAWQATSGSASSAGSGGRQVTVALGTVQSTAQATGNLATASTLNLGFTASGPITEIDVKVGQHVAQGQVLAKIDPTSAQQDVNTAEQNLQIAEDKLSEAETPTTQAPTTGANGAAAAQSNTASVSESSILSLEQAVTQAQQAVDTANAALAGTTLTAPTAGTIAMINGTVGQTMSASTSAVSSASSSSSSSSASSGGTGTGGSGGGGGGNGSSGSNASSTGSTGSNSSSSSSGSTFMQMLGDGNLRVTANFAEADIAKIRTGQAAEVSIAAQSGTVLAGKVTTISPLSSVSSNVVTYPITVTLDSNAAGLRPGMTANVTVVTASRTNVLAVPTAAIDTAGGASTVTVVSNGRDITQDVVTGLEGDSTTEITSGLRAGDVILLSTGRSGVTSANASRTGATGGGGFGGAGFGGGGFGGAN
jgi:macrolide-specific efflux system membrane fusion protein